MKNNYKNLLLLLTLFVSLAACSQNKLFTSPQIITVKPQEYNKLLAAQKKPVIILDVRTPAEYKKGCLNNAILIDIFRDDFVDAINKLDKNFPVFVYCGIGGRSAEASEILIKNGFATVYDLDGGITAWKKEGLPVFTDNK